MKYFFTGLLLLLSSQIFAQNASDSIHLNQVAFCQTGPKEAIVITAATVSSAFYITAATTGDTVFSGTLSAPKSWSYSNESVRIADFSALTTPGTYILKVSPTAASYPITINDKPFLDPAKAAIKGYYFQRASIDLTQQYASKWKRAAGHPDTVVYIHPSAASTARPAGTVIKAPKGWYDAGDYNIYIVNSGISVFTLLSAYENFGKYLDTVSLNIPESGNGVPDILNEVMWNLQWMLAMQDPNDGGVYHKLTNANFDGFIMPNKATTTRYVVQKSTAATLDFAAVMAMASRVYKPFDTQFPGFSDQCLNAALQAWQWAAKNPALYYNQTTLNAKYTPQINTGEYGDSYVVDEFNWAGLELYITTKDAKYYQARSSYFSSSYDVPSWGGVNTLGLLSLVANRDKLTSAADTGTLFPRLVKLADNMVSGWQNSAYHVPMGYQSYDFSWGSNGTAGNEGMILLAAYKLRQDPKYYQAALANADYLLGRNAVGYCFLTGSGSKKVMHPHHRVSESDGITDPVPGLLSGGTNPGQEDKCTGYLSSLPALSYLDNVCSYSTNEIAINWNAPSVFLFFGLEATRQGTPSDIKIEKKQKTFYLNQNYPNPFNPVTTISFNLPVREFVSLKIFNQLGQEVDTLINQELSEGPHSIQWDARQNASGVYFCEIKTPTHTSANKLMLVK
jgi:endoglucanase